MPHCLRCKTRGIDCNYPAKKPSSFLLYREPDSSSLGADFTSLTGPRLTSLSPSPAPEADNDRLFQGFDISGVASNFTVELPASTWFTSHETWKVETPLLDRSRLVAVESDLKRYIKRIRRWMREWIDNGSNPFIHGRLYRTRFPRCVQDAYAALSCYIHRTTSNEATVFRIIEERMQDLLSQYNISSGGIFPISTSPDPPPLDSLEHIARVHALLIYQIIGLYDGDIRLRHLSETCIPILNSWMREMVQHASNVTSSGDLAISSVFDKTAVASESFETGQGENLWLSWILAETARRAFIVGSAIHVMFAVLRERGASPCNGGMVFTTKQGAWEAQSAVAWEKLCSEEYVGLIQMADAEQLFTETEPEKVNEFAKMVLEVTFGRERMERWGVQIED